MFIMFRKRTEPVIILHRDVGSGYNEISTEYMDDALKASNFNFAEAEEYQTDLSVSYHEDYESLKQEIKTYHMLCRSDQPWNILKSQRHPERYPEIDYREWINFSDCSSSYIFITCHVTVRAKYARLKSLNGTEKISSVGTSYTSKTSHGGCLYGVVKTTHSSSVRHQNIRSEKVQMLVSQSQTSSIQWKHFGGAAFLSHDIHGIQRTIDSFIQTVRESTNNNVIIKRDFDTYPHLQSRIIRLKTCYNYLEEIYDKCGRVPQPDQGLRCIQEDIQRFMEEVKNGEDVDIIGTKERCHAIGKNHDSVHNFDKIVSYEYKSKYHKVMSMKLHDLLVKAFDSSIFNANDEDRHKIMDLLSELESIAKLHCDGEKEQKFDRKVRMTMEYPDVYDVKTAKNIKIEPFTGNFCDYREARQHFENRKCNSTYKERTSKETALSRHRILRFLCNQKYVDKKPSQIIADLVKNTSVSMIPFEVSAELAMLLVKNLPGRKLARTMNDYIDQVEYTYKKSLKNTIELLNINIYSDYRTGILESLVQDAVVLPSMLAKTAVRPEKAKEYIKCVNIIHQLRHLEIKRFVIGVIGNTKSGKSTLLSKIGFNTKPSASVHTTELGYYNLGGITFIDFPGDDDINDDIKNEFLYNFRTIDMCVIVSEINKVTTDGVFNLINKVKVNYDVPYLALLNKSDSIIYSNEENQNDLSQVDFKKVVDEKTAKIQNHFLKNKIASANIYPTCLISKRIDLALMKQYGVLSSRDVLNKIMKMLENDNIDFNKEQLKNSMK